MSDEDVSSKLLTQVARLTLRVSNLRAEIERLETERDEWKSSQARIERLEAVITDMLAWADAPTQEASPSWINWRM